MGTGSRQRISRTPSGAPPCQVTEAFTPQVLDTVSTTRRDSHLPPPSRGYATLAIDSCYVIKCQRENVGKMLKNTHLSRNRLPLCSIPVPADGKTRTPSGRRCAFTLGAPTPSPSTDKWLSGRPPRPSRRQQGQPVPANKDDASDHSSPT